MNQQADLNYSLLDAEFKDESPVKTVEKIKNILRSNQIETEETWSETGVPYCYALRITVVGTNFGVNGKGLTKEFALASGYGELMERLQLGHIGSREVQKDGHYSVSDALDERVPAKALLDKNRNWYEAHAKLLLHYTGQETSPEDIVLQFADAEGNLVATPFFNITKNTKEYLPSALRKRVYTTNGCAAGNTMEEALVQGISEIVERHHQLQIIDQAICPPDIPDEILKKYPVAYDIIKFVRSNGYRVIIKDCSLGENFPVVGACFIHEKSGRYHTHFGAYPIFEIALERALTESFQGHTIDNIANFENFSYKKSDVYSVTSVAHELAKGSWERLPNFFVGKPQYSFRENLGFTGKNNKALLKECLDYFHAKGYEVLARDSACFGFPTYQIVIPGYSEVFIYRLEQKLDDHRYASYAKKALRNLSEAKLSDMLALLKHINQMQVFTNNLSNVHGFLAGAKLAANITKVQENQLMSASLAYVYYTLGKYPETIKCIQAMSSAQDADKAEYLLCFKRYLSLVVNHYDQAEIRSILDYFHRPQTVSKLYTCLAEKRNPLEDFILRCDMSCTEDCLLHGACCQKQADALTALINQKIKALDFEEFSQKLQDILYV